jgi:hypothetical protein
MIPMPAGSGARGRRLLLGGALLALVALRSPSPAPAFAASRLPAVMLWAWERASDLRAIDADVGVAFLAQTIAIEPDHIAITPRRWPLKVSPAATLSAVTRIEMPATRLVADDDEKRIADAIATTSRFPAVAAVQIDFDATLSQRGMYRRIIEGVRRRLDRNTMLSLTALASWCVGDRWMDGLPIDEAVPMLFQLGALNEPYREVAVASSAAHRLCQSSLGTSLDEPLMLAPRGRRIYVFNPHSWTTETIASAARYARGGTAAR